MERKLPQGPHTREVGVEKQTATFGIQVAVGPDTDAEEVAEATLQLRRELLDFDVDAVEPAGGGEPPQGAKAAGSGHSAAVSGLPTNHTPYRSASMAIGLRRERCRRYSCGDQATGSTRGGGGQPSASSRCR